MDHASDYRWAIIGDATGTAGTIITCDQLVPQAEYQALLARAYRLGVRGTITQTAQPPSTSPPPWPRPPAGPGVVSHGCDGMLWESRPR